MLAGGEDLFGLSSEDVNVLCRTMALLFQTLLEGSDELRSDAYVYSLPAPRVSWTNLPRLRSPIPTVHEAGPI